MDADRTREKACPHPRATANPLSVLTFWWMVRMFRKGYSHDLAEDDLYETLADHRSQDLGDMLERRWRAHLEDIRVTTRKPSLLRVIAQCFWAPLVVAGLIRGVDEVCIRLAQPLLLGRLLQYFSTDGRVSMSRDQALVYACGVLGCSLVNTLVMHPFMMAMFHVGLKLKVACCSLMYRKALVCSPAPMQLTTLLTTDVQRFEVAFIFLHYLWIAPMHAGLVAYLLWGELGLVGVGGCVLVLLFIPLQGLLGTKASSYRLRTAVLTEERVRLMNDFIAGIPIMKAYGWERVFADMVSGVRRRELKAVRLLSRVRGMMCCSHMYVTRCAVFVSLLAYVLSGNTLTADKVFVVIAYYNILRDTMTASFPMGVTFLSEALVTMRRVQAFLLLHEVSHPVPSKEEDGGEQCPGISMVGVTACWDDGNDECLRRVSVAAVPGQLLAIVGPVGAGKTSLLHALLGELRVRAGTVSVCGRVSYSAQEPWLFPGTVRQNILFGLRFEPRRYQRVLRACALLQDLVQWPRGDATMVGERGSALSGGQRARVALARAVYKEADVYLLDDPLSAVDAHVCRHVLEDAVVQLLHHKLVVLVTHQLHHLDVAGRIVILANGTIEAQGTFSELQSTGLDFARLLRGACTNGAGSEDDVDGAKGSPRCRKRSSHSSAESVQVVSDEGLAPEQEPEACTKGVVQWGTYWCYARACGGWCRLLLLGVLMVLAPGVAMAGDLWLAHWSDVAPPPTNIHPWLTVYTALVAATVGVAVAQALLFFHTCVGAAERLHEGMLGAVRDTPCSFFWSQPAGRILNRFSKDMGYIDEVLPMTIFDCVVVILDLVTITVTVAVLNPWIVVPSAVIGSAFVMLRKVFVATARGLKRVEAVTRSPMYSHVTSSLRGLTTIRAMQAQSTLRREFDSHQDANTSAFYLFLAANRWFGLWLDAGCIVYLGCLLLGCVLWGVDVSAGSVGVAVTQAMGLMGVFQWGMRQTAELETQMTAVERVREYTRLTPEDGLEPTGRQPPPQWPQDGTIEFRDVTLSYDSEPVLRGVSMVISSGEKVGVVGRTGAGKSSLATALLRLQCPRGKVLVAGWDTSAVGLHQLRGGLSLIPQEPVMFPGTLRTNLDPRGIHKDAVLWEALQEVELKEVVDELPGGLNADGTILSVGQRQLLCLARAIVRDSTILVLDEATASVDARTDALVQRTIRRRFVDRTVLTIAHRLGTIVDSDRVLVLEAGTIVEFAPPYQLLQDPSTLLYALVHEGGPAVAQQLCDIARAKYQQQTDADTA